MGNGVRVGRLFGITIRIDWSWILIFTLVTWNLRTVFAQVHPEWGSRLAWATAFLAAILFFGSVLAHELAHSLAARSQSSARSRVSSWVWFSSRFQESASGRWPQVWRTLSPRSDGCRR